MTRELADHILKRVGFALLVLWALWATWQYAILYTANTNLNTALNQQQAAYQQLQQQVVQQLQAQVKQLQEEKK